MMVASERMVRPVSPRSASGGLVPVAATPRESSLVRIERTKELRLAAAPGDEPHFRHDPTGHWDGVCVELVRQLAAVFGVALELVETTPANAPLDLADGKFDLLYDFDMAGSAPGPDRSQPLFDDFCALVSTARFQPKTWDALDVPETMIAVEIGSPQAALIRRLVTNATITGFKTREEALDAVISGRSDAFPTSIFTALLARQRHPALGPPVLPSPYMPMPAVLAMAEDEDHRLRDVIDHWRAENRENGKIREWILAALSKFGIEPNQIPSGLSL
jgi:polar amino acid transport system substrate-binding protein